MEDDAVIRDAVFPPGVVVRYAAPDTQQTDLLLTSLLDIDLPGAVHSLSKRS